MKVSDEELVLGTGSWLLGRSERPASGLSIGEAFDAARKILWDPRAASLLRDTDPDVQFAAVELLLSGEADPEDPVEFAARLYSELRDRGSPHEEVTWLRQQIAFLGWNSARKAGRHDVSDRWLGELSRLIEIDEVAIDRLNRVSAGEGNQQLIELILFSPVELLVLRDRLSQLSETNPRMVRKIATQFHGRLEEIQFDRSGELLDFLLGVFALIAGAACRLLFRRDEAKRWFDRSESAFRHTVNAVADCARVSYQRLALRLEEREFDRVLELGPSLFQTFVSLEMREDALKTRFLEGVSLMNTDRLDQALDVFRVVCAEAQENRDERLLGIACNNLVQIHGLMGDTQKALEQAQQTLKLLRRLDNKVGLAKLQWAVGTVLKMQGNLAAAKEAFGVARREFDALGMRSDVAALHLVLADLCLELGETVAARRHVIEALPIIEAEQMVPEGMAALALLRESVGEKAIHRGALRELHGYFDRIRCG